VRRREQDRQAERQRANAAQCGLPLTEYLALSRRERKRRLQPVRRRERDGRPPCPIDRSCTVDHLLAWKGARRG
jgi:hypothetical protein